MLISENYKNIVKQLPKSTHLLAVTKNRSIEAIEELYELGQRDFGENKVQELLDKDQQSRHLKDLRWHMIGTLQTNKVKKLLTVKRLSAIHSIDNLSLAQELAKREQSCDHKNKVALFWQFNFSKEEKKHGFSSLEELQPGLEIFKESKKFFHLGLMCMGPASDDENLSNTEKVFAQMANFKLLVQKKLGQYFKSDVELSMGMSQDYHLAIKYHAHWIRLGSILYQK